MIVILFFFPFPSSTNKCMKDIDVTPPSPDACSYLPAALNGYPTFVTSIISIGLCTAVIGDVKNSNYSFFNCSQREGCKKVRFLTIPPKMYQKWVKRETELKVTSKHANMIH